MLNNLIIFAFALFLVIRGAILATKYAALLAENFNISKYTVGFIVVAIISILPEALISINSALRGIPSFGLGTLFGSNVADLTLVFAIIIFFAKRGIKVESKILKIHTVYPFILLLPLILGLNGHFSRLEGLTLIIAGCIFYYTAIRRETGDVPIKTSGRDKGWYSFMLIFSMAMLLLGSHLTVTSASELAVLWGVHPIIIGMLIVGLGTTMPELFFSLKSVKKRDDSLAIGDILGTVLANATILVGILALIGPFSFPTKIIYVTGAFMVTASFILFRFMKTGRTLSKDESTLLFAFWLIFAIVEFIVNK